MTRGHKYSWAARVVSSLAAALVWIVAGPSIAAAQFPKLPHLPKLPGQGKPKTAGKQAEKPVPVLSSISPNTLPPGGAGELVLIGKNFFEGMQLGYGPFLTWSVKVESPERAVATIHVPEEWEEGPCDLRLQWWFKENGEISPSPLGTPEFGQIANSVKCTISNSSPMEILLGQYTLLPAEEIDLMNSLTASQGAYEQRMKAGRPSKEQQEAQKQAMEKQAAGMQEMAEKYQRGEITQAQLMEYTQKMMQNPQMAAAMAQGQKAVQQAGQIQQIGQKMQELKKQEKAGELRLKRGSSIRFMTQGGDALFTEPVGSLKEITVVPPPSGEDTSHDFQVAFNDGKKFFFRADSAEDEVSKLKKRLGK